MGRMCSTRNPRSACTELPARTPTRSSGIQRRMYASTASCTEAWLCGDARHSAVSPDCAKQTVRTRRDGQRYIGRVLCRAG